MIKRTVVGVLIAAYMIVAASVSEAGQTVGPVAITQIQPTDNGNPGAVIVTIASSALCGTNAFSINLSVSAGPSMFSTALAAFLSGKNVTLEILESGCAGPWTPLKSIRIQ